MHNQNNKIMGVVVIYQICYASRSKSDANLLLQDLRDILSEARDFNVRQHVNGVLCYADGHFFQCLEGDQAVVTNLLEKIKRDPRHAAVSILFQQHVSTEVHFQDWSMKYIGRHSDIHQFFAQLGLAQFSPEKLELETLKQFLQLLYRIPEQPV